MRNEARPAGGVASNAVVQAGEDGVQHADADPVLLIGGHLTVVQSGFGSAEAWLRLLEAWACRILGVAPRPRLAWG